MTPPTYYKVLDAKGDPCHGGSGRWSLPVWNGQRWQPGQWMPVIPNPIPCQRGYHLCEARHLLEWLLSPRRNRYMTELAGRCSWCDLPLHHDPDWRRWMGRCCARCDRRMTDRFNTRRDREELALVAPADADSPFPVYADPAF